MRELKIKRNKSFVGCLAKAKLYIEDPMSAELTINGVPCRKLGELKNGEEKTFQIGEGSVKVFVIADKLSKEYSNEYFVLPAGQEAVSLSGGFKYDMARGNAFRFDGNDNEEITAHRKKGARKGWIILAVAAVVGAVLGYVTTSGILNSPADPKTFSSEGMTITLTEDFQKADYDGYTVGFESREVVVFALEEPFSLVEGMESYSIEQYGELILEYNDTDATLSRSGSGLTYFEYDATGQETSKDFHYTAFLYRASDAFWMVRFATEQADREEYAQQIFEWAASVRFDG